MNKSIHKLFDVSKLIYKGIFNRLTEGEMNRIDNWKKENSDYERVYQDLNDEEYLVRGYKNIRNVDTKSALQKMQERVHVEKRKRRNRFFQVASSAAAVLILVFGYLQFRPQESEIFVEEIKPGGPKAILRISDGSVIDIDTLNFILLPEGVIIQKSGERRLDFIASGSSKTKKIVYNEIEIPRGGEYDLLLPDGTQVWLNSESRLKFPAEFLGEDRKVYLEGEAYFNVSKDLNKPFRVEIKNQVVEVLGTEFNVLGYNDENAVYTTLVTGRVKVISESEVVELKPGEQGILNISNGSIDIREVDVRYFTSWKDGMFILEDQTLRQIMDKFSRWYDVEIEFESEEMEELIFKGRVPRYSELSEVLSLLEMTEEVKFKVEGRKIFVYN